MAFPTKPQPNTIIFFGILLLLLIHKIKKLSFIALHKFFFTIFKT